MTKSLTYFSKGAKGRICDITGGRTAAKRLFEMGFNRGKEIEVVKNDMGPLVVDLNGCKVAIGRGMANKIHLYPLN